MKNNILIMKTNRFETFLDAILAIIITVLVLKLAQPGDATWGSLIALNRNFMTYAVCFLIIFNTWYNDHTLFMMVDEINNRVLMVYGVVIFIISLVPYFASWVSLYPNSIPAQTMFGLLFLATNFCYNLSTYLIIRANPYNEELKKINLRDFRRYVPVLFILIGYALTYTVYVQGVYISCILATVYWFFIAFFTKSEVESSERFEALFDAIVAIILTILVLEITMAFNGSWQALFDLKLEFLAYIVSFIVCFSYWNYNNNLFSIVNRIDYRVIWSTAASLFVLSLIPYLSVFVSHNFYSFVPQACYGLDFIVVALLSVMSANALKSVDPANIALVVAVNNHYQFIFTMVIVGVGIVLGYLFYPPCVLISCFISLIAFWLIPYFTGH